MFGPSWQNPLQQSALLVQNHIGSWQHLPFDPHISPFCVSHVHGPPQPSSAAHTLPTLPPPVHPGVGVHWHTPLLHEEFAPLHEPHVPPQPSEPQFLPEHWGAHLQVPPLHAMPVPQLVPSVLRVQPVVSVPVDIFGVHAPAVHVGVVTLRVRLPELAHVAA